MRKERMNVNITKVDLTTDERMHLFIQTYSVKLTDCEKDCSMIENGAYLHAENFNYYHY